MFLVGNKQTIVTVAPVKEIKLVNWKVLQQFLKPKTSGNSMEIGKKVVSLAENQKMHFFSLSSNPKGAGKPLLAGEVRF